MMLQQGRIRLVLTSGTGSNTAVAQHVHEHGDTTRDVDDEACCRGGLAPTAEISRTVRHGYPHRSGPV